MLANASPALLAAARFALFAERAAPSLLEDEQIVNTPLIREMSPELRGNLARAKTEAAKRIPAFRALLYPEDEPDV